MPCFWPFHHKWLTVEGTIWDGVYLLFRRPLGQAKVQYCAKCGTIRFAGLKEAAKAEPVTIITVTEIGK